MTNNDVLRSVRYALDLSDPTMVEIFKLAEHDIEQADMLDLLKKEDEAGYVACSDELASFFLDGLITFKRGKSDFKPDENKKPEKYLTITPN